MMKVNEYKDTLLEWFYYNDKDGTVRRAKDGYYGRYKKDDIVKPYGKSRGRYLGVHIPRTRCTIPYHHLVAILKGIEIPEGCVIDHIDGNAFNNDISNIRVITQQLNCKNKKKRYDNKTGITGINKAHDCNSYIVRKQINGERVYLGCKPTLEEAIALLESYESTIRADGYTERHGK